MKAGVWWYEKRWNLQTIFHHWSSKIHTFASFSKRFTNLQWFEIVQIYSKHNPQVWDYMSYKLRIHKVGSNQVQAMGKVTWNETIIMWTEHSACLRPKEKLMNFSHQHTFVSDKLLSSPNKRFYRHVRVSKTPKTKSWEVRFRELECSKCLKSDFRATLWGAGHPTMVARAKMAQADLSTKAPGSFYQSTLLGKGGSQNTKCNPWQFWHFKWKAPIFLVDQLICILISICYVNIQIQKT